MVLSLWPVDDKATSLLMARFYQDLLGWRPGLSRTLPKAEAKRWPPGLTADEVGPALEALDRGPMRPLVTAGPPAANAPSPGPRPPGPRPYEHPYYWAAFVLIGDPS
jgi:CHAT domain-containing protein